MFDGKEATPFPAQLPWVGKLDPAHISMNFFIAASKNKIIGRSNVEPLLCMRSE